LATGTLKKEAGVYLRSKRLLLRGFSSLVLKVSGLMAGQQFLNF